MRRLRDILEGWSHGQGPFRRFIKHDTKIDGHDVQTTFTPRTKWFWRKTTDHNIDFTVNDSLTKHQQTKPVNLKSSMSIYKNVMDKGKQFHRHFGGKLVLAPTVYDKRYPERGKLYDKVNARIMNKGKKK